MGNFRSNFQACDFYDCRHGPINYFSNRMKYVNLIKKNFGFFLTFVFLKMEVEKELNKILFQLFN